MSDRNEQELISLGIFPRFIEIRSVISEVNTCVLTGNPPRIHFIQNTHKHASFTDLEPIH